ncbi:MAG: FAD-dependent oxidoreductase [Gammaproteobacteria bacterium]|nr:FAD-dependent oxidoreductase [Gammaproteobacteria bacterium]
MSKKFKPLQWGKTLPHFTLNESEWRARFECFRDESFVLGDLNFSDGFRFAKIQSLWLEQSQSTQVLYYLACCHTPSKKHAWGPILPGMQVHALHGGRIQLILLYGEPHEQLSAFLFHGQGDIESRIRTWKVQAWLLDTQAPSDSFLELMHLLEGKIQGHVLVKSAPWAFPSNFTHSKTKNIAVIGGGFAGCYMARTIAEAGFQVTLFEAESTLAKVGSGNRYSLLYPKLSAHQAPFTELLHLCYPFAQRMYQSWIERFPNLGKQVEIWQSGDAFHQELMPYLNLSPQWFMDLDDAYLMKQSMLLDMPLFCDLLVEHPNITCHLSTPIQQLEKVPKGWVLESQLFTDVVLANGHVVHQFKETQYLGIKGMRGQMTHVREIYNSPVTYCQDGHFCASWKGVHGVGASFDPNTLNLDYRWEDDEKNVEKWRDFFVEHLRVCGHWTGIRGVSLDHIPCVGAAPDVEAFKKQFAIWRHHANLKCADKMPNHPGLWVFAGFGSRGLSTIPYLAEILINMVLNKPMILQTHLIQSLSPARFCRKKLIRKIL